VKLELQLVRTTVEFEWQPMVTFH